MVVTDDHVPCPRWGVVRDGTHLLHASAAALVYIETRRRASYDYVIIHAQVAHGSHIRGRIVLSEHTSANLARGEAESVLARLLQETQP